jgi:hypothetical protein
MSGNGFGMPGQTQTAYNPTTGTMGASASSATPTTGSTAPTTTGQTPSTAPQGLLQADNSNSGFQLAPTSQTPGTNIMGTPSWMSDWSKAGSPDLNSWYQQQQGGYMDMSKPTATPAQLQFAPPPPSPAAAAPAPAAAAAPAQQQQQGNWWTPKSGPAPAVTKNTLWGSTPVGQAELDALPDAFVRSQSFLNQYGRSPGAQEYQKWRLGPEAYFNIQNQQNDIRQKAGQPAYYG